MKKLFFLFVLVLFSSISSADANNICKLTGKVIKVADGDTITILDSKKKQHRIRLAGIDAPERKQPFGKASKKYLSKLVYKKQVCINWHKKDKYKRKVGKVLLNDVDINFKIIDKGLAWHYKKYQKEQSKADQRKYAEAEIDAQLAVIGLWSRPDYIPPWKWRKGKRPKRISKQEKKRIILAKRKVKASPTDKFTCGIKRFCKHMDSCAEARFYLTQCHLKRLDRDHDGIPCESICGH